MEQAARSPLRKYTAACTVYDVTICTCNMPNKQVFMHNAIAYRSHAVFPEVEMLHGHTVMHSFPRHFHDTFGLAIIHSGVELCWMRGAERVFHGGDVVLFNAGEVHDGRPGASQGWTYDMVYFPHDLVCRLLDTSDCWFDAISCRDPATMTLAQQALRVSHDADTDSATEESLVTLLTQLMHRHYVYEPDPVVAARVREYIDAHAEKPLNVQHFSEISGLSPEHTIRSFRRRYGITPHAYHQARRAESARQKLRGKSSLTEVAMDLGFYDQSHFTNWFRNTQGVPPGSFRAALKS